ncbi:unnamed protein product [Amoebophrya sp. A25]|nr:unnamed protein product [Amoebophrya sp. A25]|eukprot:GSA25T00018360001.1
MNKNQNQNVTTFSSRKQSLFSRTPATQLGERIDALLNLTIGDVVESRGPSSKKSQQWAPGEGTGIEYLGRRRDSYSPTSHRRLSSESPGRTPRLSPNDVLDESHHKFHNDHHFRAVKPSPLPPSDGGELTGLVSILADSVRKYAPDEAALALDTEALCMRVAEIESESKTLEQSILELNSRVNELVDVDDELNLLDEDGDEAVYPTTRLMADARRDLVTLPGPSVDET